MGVGVGWGQVSSTNATKSLAHSHPPSQHIRNTYGMAWNRAAQRGASGAAQQSTAQHSSDSHRSSPVSRSSQSSLNFRTLRSSRSPKPSQPSKPSPLSKPS